MIDIAGLDENVATIVLLIFGVAGILGSFLFSRYNEKRSPFLMGASVICVSISLSLMYPLGINIYTIFVLCIFWGISFMIFNLVFQDTVIKVAPDATAVAMSIYSGIYNVGIGSGGAYWRDCKHTCRNSVRRYGGMFYRFTGHIFLFLSDKTPSPTVLMSPKKKKCSIHPD